jgi:hypothetical protein
MKSPNRARIAAVIRPSGISPQSTTSAVTRPIPTHTSLPPCSRPSRTSPPGGPEVGPSLTAAARDGRTSVRAGMEEWLRRGPNKRMTPNRRANIVRPDTLIPSPQPSTKPGQVQRWASRTLGISSQEGPSSPRAHGSIRYCGRPPGFACVRSEPRIALCVIRVAVRALPPWPPKQGPRGSPRAQTGACFFALARRNDILLDWITIVFAVPRRAYSGETGLHEQRLPEIGRIEWRFWTCYALSIAFAWTADRVAAPRATPVTGDLCRVP